MQLTLKDGLPFVTITLTHNVGMDFLICTGAIINLKSLKIQFTHE